MIKKLIYILMLFIFSTSYTLAGPQKGHIEIGGFPFIFRHGDNKIFAQQADKNMKLFEQAQQLSEKDFYLHEAMRYYFMLSNADKKSIDAQIGLGRVYDAMNLDTFAQKYFYVALNMQPQNPKANLYFANFYFERNDLINALYYYKIAYANGYSKNYDINYQLGSTYEKLADIETAKKFYNNALKLNPNNTDLANKLNLLNQLNYGQSQYYFFNKSIH